MSQPVQGGYEGAQRQMLDFVRQSQEAFVTAMGAWTEMVGQMAPSPANERLGSQYMDLSMAVEGAFASARRVLDAQQAFAQSVLRSTSDVAEITMGAARQTTADASGLTQIATEETAATTPTQAQQTAAAMREAAERPQQLTDAQAAAQAEQVAAALREASD